MPARPASYECKRQLRASLETFTFSVLFHHKETKSASSIFSILAQLALRKHTSNPFEMDDSHSVQDIDLSVKVKTGSTDEKEKSKSP
jgi:hypothetical protein